jgi:hypothetical protein
MFDNVLCYDESGKFSISLLYQNEVKAKFVDNELKENFQKSFDQTIDDLTNFLKHHDYNHEDLKLIFQIIQFCIPNQNRNKIFEKFQIYNLDLLNEESPNFVNLFDTINFKNSLYLVQHYPRDFEGKLKNILPEIPVIVVNFVLCDIIEALTKEISESTSKPIHFIDQSPKKNFTKFINPILGSLQIEIQEYSLDQIFKSKSRSFFAPEDHISSPSSTPSSSTQIQVNQNSKGSKLSHT